MEARLASQPIGVIAVVQHQMNFEVLRDRFRDVVQEPALHRPVAREASAEHLTGGYVQGRKQRRGSVPAVVVGAPLREPWTHPQHRLAALESAASRHAQHHRTLGRMQVQDVAYLLDEPDRDSLKPLRAASDRTHARCGLPSPHSSHTQPRAQMRSTRLQLHHHPTSSSPIVRGAPGRGSSSSQPSRRNRRRHLPTVARVAPSCPAMSLLPAAVSSTIRDRPALAQSWTVSPSAAVLAAEPPTDPESVRVVVRHRRGQRWHALIRPHLLVKHFSDGTLASERALSSSTPRQEPRPVADVQRAVPPPPAAEAVAQGPVGCAAEERSRITRELHDTVG